MGQAVEISVSRKSAPSRVAAGPSTYNQNAFHRLDPCLEHIQFSKYLGGDFRKPQKLPQKDLLVWMSQ